jgi:flagellar P-ring protein precursor FlgI
MTPLRSIPPFILPLMLPWLALAITPAHKGPLTRVKELTSIEGVRDNQLIGYGICVGLAGTGDRLQTVFSAQSLSNLLQRMGISVPGTSLRVANTAAVLITATLPPFAQTGTRIDVTAASAGDASNLQGGLLLLTALKGSDGQVYAMAQGPLVTGGFGAVKGGSSQSVNHPTVGRVVSGALVEKAPPSIAPTSELRLQLKQADFTTAARIAEAINQRFDSNGKQSARAENSALVSIQIPLSYSKRTIEFIAEVEAITVEPDRALKVVVNERTGTIVMGKEVRIAPTAILHGNLSVEIQTTLHVSQPAPLSAGQTTAVPQVTITTKEAPAKNVTLKDGATVEDLVRALTSIGSTPRDVIAILQALRASGALEAEMEII